MTTVENFKCIFCSADFNDKELLQEHFRKHGDPEFNKTKLQNEVPSSTEKSEEIELVGCDVCEERFPTISKAITHKHKMHPDHDAKYFCPWCGKLFTMKHLYNKHIKISHNGQTNCDVKDYHCDKCSVYFYVPSAMLHHNKFFHRQDIEMNSLGTSKKVSLFNQELVSILYCPFCGEEYNNKVNLDKHMEDDHADENQSPEDILRCPLCEAILYHLDAYELHLTFHSTEDTYSEPNEMVTEITEFSLEAVPPLMEKVLDANDSVDNYLQMIVDESGESSKVKLKKHKKHKKSKKETITLDEFLNMNKDVFGDGLNVQGIEEVPTQMVLKKKYKTKKPEINVTNTVKQDLAKLKKQGIVIKSNSNKVVPNTFTSINKMDTINKNNITNAKAQTSKDANEVISKLMCQQNSQIKIIKTTAKQDTENKQDSYQSSKIDSSSDYDNKMLTEENHEEANIVDKEDCGIQNVENVNKPLSPNINDVKEQNLKITGASCETDNPFIDDENTSLPKTAEDNSPVKSIQTIGPGVTIKSLSLMSCDKDAAEGSVQDEAERSAMEEMLDDHTDDGSDEPIDSEDSTKQNTLQCLNLNKGITIKSVKNTMPTPAQLSDPENENSKDNTNIQKPLTSIKGLPNITVKSSTVSPLSNHQMSDDDENNDTTDDEQTFKSEISKQDSIMQSNADILKRLTNVTAKPLSPKVVMNMSSKGNVCKTRKNLKCTMENDVEVLHIDDSDSDADIDHAKHKPNLTGKRVVKPMIKKVAPQHVAKENVTVRSSQQSSQCIKTLTKNGQKECKKMTVTRTFESKNINVTNSGHHLTEEQKSLQKTLNNLKHVTIKPKTPFNYKEEDPVQDEDDDYNSDQHDDEYNSDTSVGKVQISEMHGDEADECENSENDNENANVESPPQSPHTSCKNFDDNTDFDIEDQIKSNPIKKTKTEQDQTPNNFPVLNKEITIKPAKKSSVEEVHSDDVKNWDVSKNLQTKPNQRQQMNRNAVQSRKASSSNEVNTVKSVKTYQSQTVIEEVTTTVTKTIRTVNTQEVKNASQTVSKPRPQKAVHTARNPNQCTPRPASFVGAKVRNNVPPVRTVVANSTNTLVPTRPRFATPQMPCPSSVRKPSPIAQNRLRAPNIKPLRNVSPAAKRAADEQGHFSCFKKQKESLYPVDENEDKQYTNVRSKSTFSNVTQVQNNGSQMRSETSTSSQSISKLSGVSGLKIVKTSKQATHVEEKCEVPAPKNSTMAALEKLQKQGLLIKKPRLEMADETHSHSENEDSDDG